MRVSPQSSNRMVDGARSVLNDLLADVYIFTDHMTGQEAGQSPGYGLMLVAETTTGCFISAECTANASLKVSDVAMIVSLVRLDLYHCISRFLRAFRPPVDIPVLHALFCCP